MQLKQGFAAARRASVPLVVVESRDAVACVRSLVTDETLARVGEWQTGWVQWDCANGATGMNEQGMLAVGLLAGDFADGLSDPVYLLKQLHRAPPGTVVFMHNAQRFIDNVTVMQAIANLRDVFKANFRMLVMMGPTVPLPMELEGHVVVLDDPLPSEEQIRGKLERLCADAKVKTSVSDRAVDSQRGLIEFAVEQNGAMNLKRTGFSEDDLWEAKRKQIEQTPGLQVLRSSAGFDAVGGCETIKGFLRGILNGKRKPKSIVFIDEIEKAMAGASGDTSGVSQDQLGALLSHMQDSNATGLLFYGPPGAAKSATAKAAGHDAGIPTIKLDLGAAKGSLVGQSEQQLRQALKVIDAVSSGSSLWIATCNSMAALPTELRRRFTLGMYFFDLPTADERKAIWEIYRPGGKPVKLGFDDEGWTGAEIERCVDIADRLGCSLAEAAKFIVPISVSAAEQIAALRSTASGKFLSASEPGVYVAGVKAAAPATPQRRMVAME